MKERERGVEVEEELARDDGADAIVGVLGLEHERVVGVVAEQHHVEARGARSEGRGHAEHPVAREGRREAIERQRRLALRVRWSRGRGGGGDDERRAGAVQEPM
jgi:hypothetical protein